jgi:hypothetical protein
MSTLTAATRFTSGRLKKSAHPTVAADKASRTNPANTASVTAIGKKSLFMDRH